MPGKPKAQRLLSCHRLADLPILPPKCGAIMASTWHILRSAIVKASSDLAAKSVVRLARACDRGRQTLG